MFWTNKAKQLYGRFREIILYGLIGGFCAALDFGVYTLLGRFWISFLWANVISVHVGILCSFLLNRQYSFRVKDHPGKRFTIFYIVGLSGLALSELLIFLFATKAGGDYIMVKFFTIAIVALYQFLMNKFITFRKSTNG